MSTNSNGTVEFSAYIAGESTPIFVTWYHTGGTYFIAYYKYDGYVDYTDYEEVDETTNQFWPYSNFNFTGNTESDWVDFGGLNSPPPNNTFEVLTTNNDVTIDNEFFYSTIATTLGIGGLGQSEVAPGSNVKINGYVFKAFTPDSGSTVYLNLISIPSGWSYSFSPSGGSPTLSFYVDISVPSGTSNGIYKLTMQVTNHSTTGLDQFLVAVSTSGGGCVAFGSPVLTSNGYVPVQHLKPGDKIEEYDFNIGLLITGTLLNNSATEVTEIVSINGGVLLLTPTDQPIYVRNFSYSGWLRDPQNLTSSDQIFDPVNNTWINITNISLINEHIKVYDVVTGNFNNFVDNGFLMDTKT